MDSALVAFVVVAYALSIAFSLLIGLTGGHQSPLIGLDLATMFFPAVALLVVRFGWNAELRIDWGHLPLRYVPLALLLIPAVMHAAMLPLAAAASGGLPWQDWLASRDGFYHTPAERGWGTVSRAGLMGHLLTNALIGVAVVTVFALFEEMGWRGWLLPRLAQRTGMRGAIVVVAAISTLWHTPYALSGIHHLDGVPVSTTAMVLPIGLMGAGLVIGWLWARTGSIWIAAMAHGSLNNWGQYAFKFMRQDADFGGHQALVLAAGGVALLITGGLLLAFVRPPCGKSASVAELAPPPPLSPPPKLPPESMDSMDASTDLHQPPSQNATISHAALDVAGGPQHYDRKRLLEVLKRCKCLTCTMGPTATTFWKSFVLAFLNRTPTARYFCQNGASIRF